MVKINRALLRRPQDEINLHLIEVIEDLQDKINELTEIRVTKIAKNGGKISQEGGDT